MASEPAMSFTLFYAWQSDRPNNVNRTLIQEAAQMAIDAIKADAKIEESPRLDHDTKDLPGTPGIATAIYKKIDACGIFLADVTFVGRTDEERKRGAPKLLPNPNVLLELGHAGKSIGGADWERIILVMNTAYGPPEEQVFDFQHRRHPICYHAAPGGADRAGVRRELARKLEDAIRAIIASGALRRPGDSTAEAMAVARTPRPDPIVLEATLEYVGCKGLVYAESESVAVIELFLRFVVQHVKGVVARTWDVRFNLRPVDEEHSWRFKEAYNQPSNEPLLPTSRTRKACEFGFRLRRGEPLGWQLKNGLYQTVLEYHTISETGPGEPMTITIGEAVDVNAFERSIETALRNSLGWH